MEINELIISRHNRHCLQFRSLATNVSGLCVVALNRDLKLTTTLNRAITQNPYYVPLFLEL
jgi:hypothetical protein